MNFIKYQQIIKTFLKDRMTDYILLDLPYYPNVGDVLIWQSTLDILKDLPYKCLYSSAIETYKKPRIKDDVLIVFMGGGNFGDLWERHQEFRYRVMKDFPSNPILQLPQSVCFESNDKMKYDIDFFSKHKGKVYICLREKKSYEVVVNNYKNVETFLLPDMVLSFDVEQYCRKHKIVIEKGKGSLLVQRNDKEKVEISMGQIPDSLRIADWPSMEVALPEMNRYNILSKYMNNLRFPISIRSKVTDWYFKHIMKEAFINSGIKFILPYEVVYATRLHAAILAFLLGKRTYIYDNSYGKSKGVFYTWMSDCKNISLL